MTNETRAALGRAELPRVLRGAHLSAMQATLEGLEIKLEQLGFERIHIPPVLPPSVAEAISPHLGEDLALGRLTTRTSDRPRGYLAFAGLALQAVPLLSVDMLSWRRLPLAVYSVGPVVHPMDSWSTLASEDLLALHGLMAGMGLYVFDRLCSIADEFVRGPDTSSSEKPILLAGGRVRAWRDKEGVLAYVAEFPPPVVTALGIRVMTAADGLCPPVVASIYFSETALAGGAPPT